LSPLTTNSRTRCWRKTSPGSSPNPQKNAPTTLTTKRRKEDGTAADHVTMTDGATAMEAATAPVLIPRVETEVEAGTVAEGVVLVLDHDHDLGDEGTHDHDHQNEAATAVEEAVTDQTNGTEVASPTNMTSFGNSPGALRP
jgi:hypothetical protein